MTKYVPVGLTYDSEIPDPKDEVFDNKADPAYSMVGKMRQLSQEAARNRITSLRKQS